MKQTGKTYLMALLVLLGIAKNCIAQIEANVPLARLLATPERYDGKTLSTSGVFHVDRDGVRAIYLDAGSASGEITGNAILLLTSRELLVDGNDAAEAEGQYVLVVAQFDGTRPRRVGYSGMLKDVVSVRTYPLIKPIPGE